MSTTTTTVDRTPSGKLAGLKGTAPVSELPEQMLSRLRKIDPTVEDLAADTARPYDATIVATLAAELARTDQPAKIAGQIIDVTGTGKKCTDYASCRRITDDLGDPDYDGLGGNLNLSRDGKPSEATYGVLQFGRDDQLTKLAVKSTQSTAAVTPKSDADPTTSPRPDGVLTIGMVFPTTGPSSRTAAAQRAGVRLAIDEINRGGGSLGTDVVLLDADSGDGSPEEAFVAATKLIDKGADVIIGGSGSEDTKAMVDPVTAAGVVLLSPDATSQSLDTVDDRGLFFRFAPSNALQGSVLADVVAGDGFTQVALVAQNGADGAGLALDFRSALEQLGGTVSAGVPFDTTEAPAAVIDRALASPADAIVILADPAATGRLVDELITRGQSPTQTPTYVANISVAMLS